MLTFSLKRVVEDGPHLSLRNLFLIRNWAEKGVSDRWKCILEECSFCTRSWKVSLAAIVDNILNWIFLSSVRSIFSVHLCLRRDYICVLWSPSECIDNSLKLFAMWPECHPNVSRMSPQFITHLSHCIWSPPICHTAFGHLVFVTLHLSSLHLTHCTCHIAFFTHFICHILHLSLIAFVTFHLSCWFGNLNLNVSWSPSDVSLISPECLCNMTWMSPECIVHLLHCIWSHYIYHIAFDTLHLSHCICHTLHFSHLEFVTHCICHIAQHISHLICHADFVNLNLNDSWVLKNVSWNPSECIINFPWMSLQCDRNVTWLYRYIAFSHITFFKLHLSHCFCHFYLSHHICNIEFFTLHLSRWIWKFESECIMSVTRMSHECHLNVTWMSPECHLNVTWMNLAFVTLHLATLYLSNGIC